MRFKILAGVLAVLVVSAPLAAQQASAAKTLPPLQRNSNYGQLPLTFEVNQGQTASQVKFLSRGKGYSAFLTAGGMVLGLRPSTSYALPSPGKNGGGVQQPLGATLQFQLTGANLDAAVVGEDPQPGRVNYFLGNNPAKWRTNVPTYAQVRYKNIYPGIDLIYYGNHQQLEYDFSLAPGADPGKIQFHIQGASQVSLDAAGNLVLDVKGGQLHFQSPVVYQQSNGQRVPVKGQYVVRDSSHVAFQVADYDSSKPLVIDPVLEYSTYLGGSGTDQLTGIAVDATGNVYLAGYTDSADFPLATLGSLPSGANHVFVAKLDASGSNLVYADYIGGSSQDYGIALVLDASNNVYVTGSTQSSDFPVVNAYQASQPGPYSGFVTKVSADGSSLLYSTYLGGNTFDQPTSVAIDSLNEVHVAGYTLSQNFPVANAYQSSASANEDGLYGEYGFLTKLSANGGSLVYSTYVAGNSNVVQDCGSPCWPAPYNVVSTVAVDANGNAYVSGTTNTYNFPATTGAYLTTNSTQQDATVGFVSKFDSTGSLDYSTYLYGSSGAPVGISAIAVDGSGSAFITGTVASDGTFPVTSTSICDPGTDGFACSYAFVTKFDSAGATLLYSTFLGPNNYSSPQSLALDSSGDAWVLASTSSGLLETNNAIESYSSGADLQLVEIDPAATTQLFSTYLGGSGDDNPSGIALDSTGNIYVAGTTNSSDFPLTEGAFQTVLGGGSDAFVMKIGAASAPSVSVSPAALQFAPLPLGSTSQAQTVLLRNMGSASLSISSIATTGDFAETNTCDTSVPSAASCTLSVTFTPTAAGSRSGSIVIQDNASGAPHSIPLNGVGAAANVMLSPGSLTFSSEAVGASSASQPVTLTNSGNASLNISNVQVTGDFSQTNNCPGTLNQGSSCTINVVFTPTATGSRSGNLTVTDDAQGSPQSMTLSGTGADFSLASSTSQQTVQPGGSGTYALTVDPVGGSFTQAVSLSCSGLPANTTCSFSPGTVTPGANNTPDTLTITASASAALAYPNLPGRHHPIYAVLLQLQGLGIFGIVVAGSRKRSQRSNRLVFFAVLSLLIFGTLFLSGCAGGTGIAPQNQQGNTSHSYTITVTGTSGTLQHSVPVTLTIQ